MKYFWRVARYEYTRNVFKRSFILLMLSIPALIAFSVGLGILMESLEDKPLPVGYVDQVGIFAAAPEVFEFGPEWAGKYDEPLSFIAYPTEADAQEALKDGLIQVFYTFPPDYFQERRLVQTFIEKPGQNAESQFWDFLQLYLLADQPGAVAYRAAAGSQAQVRSADGSRSFPSGGPSFGHIVPLFIIMAFLFMITMSSGYTMSAVAEEKENRTMEVLVTSISPTRLIGGKILGIVLIGLTLMASWSLVVVLAVTVARAFGLGWFTDLSMDWRPILTALAMSLPAYTLALALMTAVGAMVTTTREGQSMSGIFVVLHMLPLYISWNFINTPHSPLSVGLTLAPFTALMSYGMRNLGAIVPAWQIAASVAVQTLCAIGAIWLAGRALRLGLLRYGQRLTLRGLFQSPARSGGTNHG